MQQDLLVWVQWLISFETGGYFSFSLAFPCLVLQLFIGQLASLFFNISPKHRDTLLLEASNVYVLYRILPESIRWLITKKHYPQVKQFLLREIGRNEIHVPDYVLASRRGETKRNLENSVCRLYFTLCSDRCY